MALEYENVDLNLLYLFLTHSTVAIKENLIKIFLKNWFSDQLNYLKFKYLLLFWQSRDSNASFYNSIKAQNVQQFFLKKISNIFLFSRYDALEYVLGCSRGGGGGGVRRLHTLRWSVPPAVLEVLFFLLFSYNVNAIQNIVKISIILNFTYIRDVEQIYSWYLLSSANKLIHA